MTGAEVMSVTAFKWLVTFLTGGLAGAWLLYDTWNLIRTRGMDVTDPVNADKRFGYVIGIAIGAVGEVGVLRFHGVA